MKRTLSLAFAVCLTLSASAVAETINFNGLVPTPDSFDRDAGAGGQFVIGGNGFNNSYAELDFGGFIFKLWDGWALSNKTTGDPTLPDYDDANQFTSITLGGAGGSEGYAMAFAFTQDVTDLFHPNGSIINLAAGKSPVSIDVTNSLYAFRSMTEGDLGGGKKFEPGDFFRLDIQGFSGTDGLGAVVGEVDFDLASTVNGVLNIVTNWNTLDLTPLAAAKSLRFGFTSSDNGSFGILTPAYVAVDNFRVQSDPTATPEPGTIVLLAGFLSTMAICRGKHRRRVTAPLA